MSPASKPEKKLKVISLQPKVFFIKESEQKEAATDSIEEGVIIAPILIGEQAIEKLSDLVDKVYEEFSQACKKNDLKWEAELEMGLELGVKFTAKLKIAPKS